MTTTLAVFIGVAASVLCYSLFLLWMLSRSKYNKPIESDCCVSMSFAEGYPDSTYAVTGSVDGDVVMSYTNESIKTGAGYTIQGYIKGNPAQIKSIVKAICVATKNSNCADAMRLYAKQLKVNCDD